jgi:DNA-binding transcriptional MerR regulator
MQYTQDTPTFNMKAVVQETGLKPDTVRAWERRYGLPMPERTEGKHRLYSQRDIETLKWLVARQQEGLSISHAVELYHRLESEGQDPLLVGGQPVGMIDIAPRVSLKSGANLDDLRQAWLKACMSYDESTADGILAEAFAMYQPEQVCFEILQRGLQEIGEGWYEGSVSVQQEHFASELAMRRLEAMVAANPPPTRSGRILVGCPAGEEHTFGPLLTTLILRRQGWEVIYLGANVPMDRLEATLESTRPQLVIFIAQQLLTAASLLQVAWRLQEQMTQLAYGGRIFNQIPELRKRIPGHFLGQELEGVADTVENILTRPLAMPVVEPISEEFEQTLSHFREQQAAIESTVWKILEPEGFTYSSMHEANNFLAQKIAAALYLGDLSFLSVEIGWLSGLLHHREMESLLLPLYLEAYKKSITQNMDKRNEPILEWLNQLLAAEIM